MRKLLLLLFSLCLFATVEGQIIRANPFAKAQVASGPVAVHDSIDASAYYLHARFLYGDGSATYMTDDGSVLTQWTDQSGDNNHIVNASGTDRPAKDAVNGEIDFDDTDDVLVDATFSYATAVTVYAVVRVNSASNNDDFFTLGTTTNCKVQILDATNRSLRVWRGGSFFDTANGFYPASTYFIVCVVFNNDVVNGSSIQVNGGAAKTGTLASASTSFLKITTETGANPGISAKEFNYRTTADDSTLRTAIINNLNSTYSVY